MVGLLPAAVQQNLSVRGNFLADHEQHGDVLGHAASHSILVFFSIMSSTGASVDGVQIEV